MTVDPGKIKRDMGSFAVLNTDAESLMAYKAKKNQREKIKELESNINTVKNDLLEIKNMLQQIINNRG
jgi:hypothetical protein